MNAKRIGTYASLSVLCVLFSFPIVWLVWTSLKTPVDAAAMPPVWVFQPQWSNYANAWSDKGFASAFLNTVIIGIGTVIVSTALGLPLGYSLARSPVRGKWAIGIGILFLRMLPEMIFLIPLYGIYRVLGLFDTYTGMILAFQIVTLPFAVWLLRGFVDGVPVDVEDVARVDGCTDFQVLRHITVPLVLPGIVTSAMFTFVAVWGGLLFPLTLGYSNAETISVAIANFRGYSNFQWPTMAAGAVIATLPQILFFGFVQRHLVAGMTAGSVSATTIYVTHDQTEAMTMGDRIAVFAPLHMSNGCNLMQCDTPMKLYAEPQNVFVAQFIGSPKMNIIAMKIDHDGGRLMHDGHSLDIPEEWRDKLGGRDAVLVGIRPEHLKIASSETDAHGSLAAVVDVVERLGDEAIIHLICSGDRVTVRIGRDDAIPAVGEMVRLRPLAGTKHLFDTSTKQRLK